MIPLNLSIKTSGHGIEFTNPDDESYYSSTGFDAVHICAGAPNPEGVVVWESCKRVVTMTDAVREITVQQQKENGWTDEMIEMMDRFTEISIENIVIDFSGGINAEYSNMADQAGRSSMYQTTWTEIKAQYADPMLETLKQYNADMAALS